MNCKLVVGEKYLKRFEVSDCTMTHGFRLVVIGYIPNKKLNDLSVLLAKLIENNSLSTDGELKKFKKCCRKERLIIWEKTFLSYEPKSTLNDKEEDNIVPSVTTYFHIHRTPIRWFLERWAFRNLPIL